MHAHTHRDRQVSVTVTQGTHTAMKSGMLAAQATFSALTAANTPTASSPARQAPVDISSYQKAMEDSYVWDELRDSRNIRPG
jgi:electron-transferring-flavoprotein dehydrogenase